jgi:adenylate cyclase
MAVARVERRLAAILAADVAGYSRLMGVDEEGTLATLKGYRRDLIDPKIAEHHGRIVKTTGDGALVEFGSAVDAVRCAMEIQRAMAEHNAAIAEDRRIEFRIGINVGDIIIDENDMYGDGVNIAARVETLASPGAICLSDNAYQQIKGKLTVDVSDMGEQQLKNIAQPIRVYGVRFESAPARPALALPDRPSIAVLPFQNMSGDPEQEYFADGMVEDIITGLSRIKWLFVIARNSTFTYKGRAVDVKQVGRELGVRYVLEGSVRKAADRVRITGQLIDTATGAHLWAERYDRKADDIFALQDEITLSVVGAIEPSLRLAEVERVSVSGRTVLMPTISSCMQCLTFIQGCQSNQKRRLFFSKGRLHSIQPTRWRMPMPRSAIILFSSAPGCMKKTGRRPSATRRPRSRTVRMTQWLSHWRDLALAWTGTTSTPPLPRSMPR